MQKSPRIAEISTKVVGGGVLFHVHPVDEKHERRHVNSPFARLFNSQKLNNNNF